MPRFKRQASTRPSRPPGVSRLLCGLAAVLTLQWACAQPASPSLHDSLDAAAHELEQRVIDWRRDIHAHPELGFQETRTAALVAEHLRALDFDEVHTGIGRTGVVGILDTGRPGPTVALRADMDALPIREQTGLPFASTATANWYGEEVPVMHACGHDAHVAILMGVAQILSRHREQLAGSVMLIFQPAEEGTPEGSGAAAMLDEGLYDIRRPDAVFGLHVGPFDSGQLQYRAGPMAAASDSFEIRVRGEGTHGAMPWGGTDALSAAAQMAVSLQSVVSRRLDLRGTPAIVSVGYLNAGNRANVIPDEASLGGTVRTFSPEHRDRIHGLLPEIADGIAASYDVSAETSIEPGYPVLHNDPGLGDRMLPSLERVAGGPIPEPALNTASEDFGLFTDGVPGMYIGLGVAPDSGPVYPNHSPRFTLDEGALVVGVRALSHLAADFLTTTSGGEQQ